MKILIIGATHGNELLGLKFYNFLLEERSVLLEHINFIIGNPRAYAKNVRYVDADLNRCYNTSDASYESMRAQHVAEYIRLNKFDIVLDMHTTNCVQEPSVIISSMKGDSSRRFLRASHVKNVVIMPKGNDIVSHIHNSVAYEIRNVDVTRQMLEAIEQDIERFVDSISLHASKTMYEVNGKIVKAEISEDDALTLENFKMSKLGYIPFLTGNNSYRSQTNYLGFKMLAPREIKV